LILRFFSSFVEQQDLGVDVYFGPVFTLKVLIEPLERFSEEGLGYFDEEPAVLHQKC